MLRVDGFRVIIWPNDHAPPHVHVFSAAAQATIELAGAGCHPRLRENLRMKPALLAKALQVVFEHQAMLIQKWREIHG